MRALFDEAKTMGKLKEEADSASLSRLVMSSVEGAILICKASKDAESMRETVETLKSVISGYKV